LKSVEAHGGLVRWDRNDTLTAKASITGVIWSLKGKPGVLDDVSLMVNLRGQRLTTNLTGRNRRFVFAPHRVAVETEDGLEIDNRKVLDPSSR
jgi:hypothetical protein